MFFPQHGVRYLALNDGVDTLNDNNDIAPFKNILNDMYAKDLSRKVKTAKRTRAAQGACMCHYHYPEQCGHTHYLRYDDLYQLVLRDVRQITGLLSGHMDELVKRLYEQQQEKSGNKRIQAQIDKLEARQEAITVIIGQLYEDFAAGRAAVQSFNSLLAKYQQEQEKLSVQIQSLRGSLAECQDPAAGCAMLREAAAAYLDVQELNENLLHDLIDRIYIGHRKKKRDKWEQDICIAYQFVGELPF